MSDSDRCTVEDCRIRGQHWASCPAVGADCGCACHTGGLERPCDVDGGCHAQHDDSCPGCLPHLANTDLGWTVCSRCGGWVTMAVVEAADLVAHIRACIDGTGTIVAEPDSGGGGASIRKRPDPPVPINADAVDDADRIYVELRTPSPLPPRSSACTDRTPSPAGTPPMTPGCPPWPACRPAPAVARPPRTPPGCCATWTTYSAPRWPPTWSARTP